MTHAPVRTCLLLCLLCAAIYLTLPTNHSLTNWQEAQRLVVAREMYHNHDWLTPTINNSPYLAKPPLIYWSQLALARILPPFTGEPTLLHLRLTVAIFGTLGVLATYLAACILLRPPPHTPSPTRTPIDPSTWTHSAALWSSLALATGILYVRSARIGELDILLVPTVVGAITCIFLAWQRHRTHNAQHPLAILAAVICATLAAFAKGPIPLAIVVLAVYVPIVVHAWRSPLTDRPSVSPLRRLISTLHRTHPVAVLGIPLLLLYLWKRAATQHIDPSLATELLAGEIDDNLNILIPAAPLRNLEALAYGVGLGSFAFFAAIIWLIRDRARIRFHAGWMVLFSWIALSFIMFSIFGKGVPRYLTPIWPAVAIVGGAWIASFIHASKHPRRTRAIFAIVVTVIAGGQTYWYAVGREITHASRAPRDLISELITQHNAEPSTFATLDFYTPAIDYELERHAAGPIDVLPLGNPNIRTAMLGRPPLPLDKLPEFLQKHKRLIVLYRDGTDITQLRTLATVTPIQTTAGFTIDSGRTAIHAARLTPY